MLIAHIAKSSARNQVLDGGDVISLLRERRSASTCVTGRGNWRDVTMTCS
jgi:hypothetical protein